MITSEHKQHTEDEYDSSGAEVTRAYNNKFKSLSCGKTMVLIKQIY